MKILLVDDDPGVRAMLRDHFSVRSHEVITAGTAVEALYWAFRERPETMILDLMLPDFPGEEVLRRIKKFLPGIRVLILTGRSDPRLEQRVRTLGADSFLVKGVPLEILEETLISWSR